MELAEIRVLDSLIHFFGSLMKGQEISPWPTMAQNSTLVY